MSHSICRKDGCDRADLHPAHRCRSLEVGARDPLRIVEDASPWQLVVQRCYVRLSALRVFSQHITLRCPWSELEGFGTCGSTCRCLGAGKLTVGYLVAHYEGVLDYFEELDECVRHPIEHSIEQVVSSYKPKAFSDVLHDVQEDYGTISVTSNSSVRILHRYLTRLAERGRILRVNLGDQLYAYLKRGSKLADDHVHCREVLRDQMVS